MPEARKSNPNQSESTQKVEVVVQSPSAGDGEVNILGELAIFTLRVCFSLMMVHHGLEKLNDPGGFAEFVVGKYFPFLPHLQLSSPIMLPTSSVSIECPG